MEECNAWKIWLYNVEMKPFLCFQCIRCKFSLLNWMHIQSTTSFENDSWPCSTLFCFSLETYLNVHECADDMQKIANVCACTRWTSCKDGITLFVPGCDQDHKSTNGPLISRGQCLCAHRITYWMLASALVCASVSVRIACIQRTTKRTFMKCSTLPLRPLLIWWSSTKSSRFAIPFVHTLYQIS